MDIHMKLSLATLLAALLAVPLATVSLSVHAGSIYKCEDAKGNMSFSGEPCPTAAASLGTLGKTSSTDNQLKNTEIKKVIIKSQKDFDGFAGSLSFTNMSHVLKGLEKNRFHGLKVSYLLAQQDIQFKNPRPKYQEINYLVDVKRGQAKNRFSASYALKVKGKEEHKFLNLSNKQIISRMKSLGFGEPKIKNSQHNWAWSHGNISCNFMYTRSPYKKVKSFEYSCSVPNQG